MPFQSEAQRRYLFKFHPDIAKRWAHEYGTPKGLPYHKRKGGRKSSRLAHTLASHTLRRKRRRRIRKVV